MPVEQGCRAAFTVSHYGLSHLRVIPLDGSGGPAS